MPPDFTVFGSIARLLARKLGLPDGAVVTDIRFGATPIEDLDLGSVLTVLGGN